LRVYETTFIVNPQADDSSIDRQVNAVVDLITQNGGKIIRTNKMGTRRMAYPIQNLTQGYYADFIFEAPQSVLPKMDRFFKLEEPYIRHLVIRFDGDPRLLDPDFEREETARIPFADKRRDGKPSHRSRYNDEPRTVREKPETVKDKPEAHSATDTDSPDTQAETPVTPDTPAETPVTTEAQAEPPVEPPVEPTAETAVETDEDEL
jgi:small subunit ribosomal protein S6